jgi:hypothetical protein
MLTALFIDHPKSGGQTYNEHRRQALWASGQLAISAAAALVHAFIPAMFQQTMGRRVGAVVQVFKARMPAPQVSEH